MLESSPQRKNGDCQTQRGRQERWRRSGQYTLMGQRACAPEERTSSTSADALAATSLRWIQTVVDWVVFSCD